MKTYKLGQVEIYLEEEIYADTGNTALNAVRINGEPYCSLTVNLDELESTALAYLNVNLHNVDVEQFFMSNCLGVKVEGRDRQIGNLRYPLYKLNFVAIREPVDWQEYASQIEKACQEHREYIKTDIVQFMAQGNPNYGNEWLYVFWYNASRQKLEEYDVADLNAAQELIDFYKFSQGRTKIIVRATGEDVSNRITFNSEYHDTFKI